MNVIGTVWRASTVVDGPVEPAGTAIEVEVGDVDPSMAWIVNGSACVGMPAIAMPAPTPITATTMSQRRPPEREFIHTGCHVPVPADMYWAAPAQRFCVAVDPVLP